MRRKKRLQELTIKDNFMFGAVMLNPENCKGIIERALGIEVERVEITREKSIIYNPEFKGVRLDIYARDEKNTHYNVEMQALSVKEIEKRARHYHGQMDTELLMSGMSYRELPDTYVIFICDYDPFGEKKFRYTRQSNCREVPDLQMEDGARTIYLSTKGENEEEVPEELVKFLKYVGASLEESEDDYADSFVRQLQETVREVKVSREMGARYMTFNEYLEDEKEAGREEGREEGRDLMFVEMVEKLQKNGNLSLEDVLKLLQKTPEEFEKAKDNIKKKMEE